MYIRLRILQSETRIQTRDNLPFSCHGTWGDERKVIQSKVRYNLIGCDLHYGYGVFANGGEKPQSLCKHFVHIGIISLIENGHVVLHLQEFCFSVTHRESRQRGGPVSRMRTTPCWSHSGRVRSSDCAVLCWSKTRTL